MLNIVFKSILMLQSILTYVIVYRKFSMPFSILLFAVLFLYCRLLHSYFSAYKSTCNYNNVEIQPTLLSIEHKEFHFSTIS